MRNLLLSPPAAFIIIFLAIAALSRIFSRLSFKPKQKTEGGGDSYACGEPNYDNLAQPDYTTFFPVAFFFTMAHVAALIITTIPAENADLFAIALIYVAGATAGLVILFKR